jgi:hypothetical protein
MGGDVSVNFAREVWGHTEVKTLQRYVHLAEALVQETQSRSSAEDVEELEIKAL